MRTKNIASILIASALVAWAAASDGSSVPDDAVFTDAIASGHHHGSARPAAAPPAISATESGRIKTGLPFVEPPIIRSRKGVLAVKLTPRPAPVQISGKRVNARVYSVSAYGKYYPPAFMPPTLVIDPGDNLQVTLQNNLGEPTNLHTHGFFISPIGNQDNIFVDLLDRRTFLYNYQTPSDLSPGLYWYHPHYHPLVEEQVFGGLSGLLYVRGLEKLLPAELQGIRERFIGLKDFQVNAANTIPSQNINSDAPTNRTINGRVQPRLSLRPGETELWHIGNIGADIWYDLASSGLSFTVIAVDANPVDQTWTTNTLLMPPARRYDVLVQAQSPGIYPLITQAMNTGPAGDDYPEALLATIEVKGPPMPPARLPERIQPLDDLSKATVTRRRTFVLSENTNTNQFFINEKMFSANQVDATPVTGTVEEWVFQNASSELHPIHLHVNDAQVMSVNGVPQQARSWVDTIPIPYATQNAAGVMVPGEVVMRFKFRQFIGPYVFHCHILNHEDNGMMSIINVTSPDSE